MDEILTQLEDAVRRADRDRALHLVAQARREVAAMDVLWATVDCALIELDASTADDRRARFVERVRHGFDHDADK